MAAYRNYLPVVLLTVVSGCHSFGPLVKRDSELNCPTDVRRTVPWCWGEDAVFHCPCGPDGPYYGHRPTCWRTWPTPATVWRDSYCPCPQPAGVCGPCAIEGQGVVVDEQVIVLPQPEEMAPRPAQPPTQLVTPPVPPVLENPVEGNVAPPALEPLPPTSQTLPASANRTAPVAYRVPTPSSPTTCGAALQAEVLPSPPVRAARRPAPTGYARALAPRRELAKAPAVSVVTPASTPVEATSYDAAPAPAVPAVMAAGSAAPTPVPTTGVSIAVLDKPARSPAATTLPLPVESTIAIVPEAAKPAVKLTTAPAAAAPTAAATPTTAPAPAAPAANEGRGGWIFVR
jgi:hypothetical protein